MAVPLLFKPFWYKSAEAVDISECEFLNRFPVVNYLRALSNLAYLPNKIVV